MRTAYFTGLCDVKQWRQFWKKVKSWSNMQHEQPVVKSKGVLSAKQFIFYLLQQTQMT